MKELFKEALSHKGQLPQKLILPDGQFEKVLPADAERLGVVILRVPEEQILVFSEEAQELFREYLNRGHDN